MRSSILRRLQQLDLFGGLSSHVLVRLAMLGRLQAYEAGEVLISQGGTYDELFIVLSGRVSLTWGLATAGRARAGTELGPGAIVGNAELATGRISRVTLRALASAEVLRLDYLALMISAAPYPEAMAALLPTVRDRLVDISVSAAPDNDGTRRDAACS